jgi:hypothetical protein
MIPTIIKLTREQALERIANHDLFINRDTADNPSEPIDTEFVKKLQRAHWEEIHTKQMSPEQFSLWLETIPGVCNCRQKAAKIIAANPPRFDDWFRWGWEFHNAVNAELGKPSIAYDEASAFWRWVS